MNKIFHPKKNNKTDSTLGEDDDIVALAIQKCKLEKVEMKKQYEERMRSVQNQANETRAVTQAMVLVARTSPNDFFTLLHKEGENWNLIDLKNIAAAIQNRLQYLQKQERKASTAASGDVVVVVGDEELEQSTAQRLYTYVMMDPKADKKTVIQVISELHKALTVLE